MSSCLGQIFSRKTKLEHAHGLYARWGATVLHFCELFLGDRSMAQQAAVESFVRLFKSVGHVAKEGIPVALLGVAFRVACQSSTSGREELEPLPAAILRLAPTERAVFILHGVMSLQIPWVAAILGVPLHEASQLWAKALIEVRGWLSHDFFKERRR